MDAWVTWNVLCPHEFVGIGLVRVENFASECQIVASEVGAIARKLGSQDRPDQRLQDDVQLQTFSKTFKTVAVATTPFTGSF
jgi:hypothetical protein